MAEVTAPVSAEQQPKGFKLLRVQDNLVTICKAGKKAVFLNHGSKDVEFPSKGNIVKPATQELLKAIYDTDESYTQLIEAPKDYKAPWQQGK